MTNIFIEGIQGSGKSTLLQAIANKNPGYKMCMEGEYSPIELAWCSYMNEKEYIDMLIRYACMENEIKEKTVRENDKYIVLYTKIHTENETFYKDFENYEIYNARKSLDEFKEIVLTRYRQFRENGYLFECSFLQNIVEDLILFHQLNDDDIICFYKELFEEIDKNNFILVYLSNDEIEDNINHVKKERSDEQGNPIWYEMMMEYLVNSPYGKKHGYKNYHDLILHLQHRQELELRIIKEIIGCKAVIIPAKKWSIDAVIEMINQQ